MVPIMGGKKTSFGGHLLEEVISCLELIDFIRCKKDTDLFIPKVLIENYPYQTIYKTKGRLEWMIRNREVRYGLECKYQNSSGSTDEKLPYIAENFVFGDLEKMIVVYAGDHWKGNRGSSAITWLKNRAENIKHQHNKEMLVFTFSEFKNYALKNWKQ